MASRAICRLAAHLATVHCTGEAMLQWRDLEGHHRGQAVLSHVSQAAQLTQLHQIEAAAARLAEIVGELAHRAGSRSAESI